MSLDRIEPGTLNRSVLIVDDDTDMAEALEEYLTPHGFRIHLSHDLSQAEQAVMLHDPNLVLLDVRLGSEFGLELISRLKEAKPNLLFIVMTAFADVEVAIQALKQGAYDFVRKPVDPAALSRTISNLFDSLALRQEREAAVRALARRDANMRMAQRMGSFGSWETDQDTGDTYWSEEHYRIFGVDPETFQPSPEALAQFIHPADRETAKAGADALETATEAVSVQYRIIRPDGAVRTIQSTAQAGRAPDGTVERWFGIVQDVTERLALEQQLRQAQKMEALGQLAGGVAHEFNNLLQVIRGYTELALKRAESGEGFENDLQRVLQASDAASRLTWRLLRFGRRETLRPHVVDVNKHVRNLVPLAQQVIGEGATLELAPGEHVPPVRADPVLLDQVILDLCLNARDAMPQGGRVTLATGAFVADAAFCTLNAWARPGRYAVISVADTGTGMAPEVRGRLFEPFFTTKGVGQGSGLGLSIAYGIVQQHEGHIEVHSEEGQGSTLRIYLPAAEAPPATGGAAQAAGEAPGGTETLLVAEDEPIVLEFLTRTLEAKGYRVLTARDGPEAVASWQAHRDEIRMILMDIIMPGMDGREVYERIRGQGGAVPVLFSTGYSGDALDDALLARPDVDVVEKPYSPNELCGKIREVLDRNKP